MAAADPMLGRRKSRGMGDGGLGDRHTRDDHRNRESEAPFLALSAPFPLSLWDNPLWQIFRRCLQPSADIRTGSIVVNIEPSTEAKRVGEGSCERRGQPPSTPEAKNEARLPGPSGRSSPRSINRMEATEAAGPVPCLCRSTELESGH